MTILRLLPLCIMLSFAGPAFAQGTTCASDASGAQFVASKLHLLTPGFDFENNGGSGLNGSGTYTPPAISATPVPASSIEAFRSVFQIAPQWVRNRLCNTVDDVLIYPTDPAHETAAAAWSFWEVGNQGTKNYLAVSQRLLDLKPTLGQVETLTTAELLGAGSRRIFRIVPSAPANTFPMALLAVVAHELGHLMIARDAPASWTDCGAWRYPWQTWRNPGTRLRIRFFGHPLAGESHTNPNARGIEAIQQSILADDYAGAAAALQSLAVTAEWAGVFSAVASDFDLTQTLSLLALSQATTPAGTAHPLASLAVYIGNPPASAGTPTADLVRQLQTPNTGLWNKGQCLLKHT